MAEVNDLILTIDGYFGGGEGGVSGEHARAAGRDHGTRAAFGLKTPLSRARARSFAVFYR